MLTHQFSKWLQRFPPEVLRSEPEAVVIQVFLGEVFLAQRGKLKALEGVVQ